MKRRAVATIVIVAIALVTGAGTSVATTLLPADIGELSRDAAAIVVGRVTSLDACWTDGHHAIETLVTLEVDTYLKGDFGRAFQFRVPGGQIGRLRSVTVGAPAFALDQRVVVFLGAHGPSVPYVLGLGQGVFRVTREGADWLVTPPAIEPIVVGAVPIVRGDGARTPVALALFEQRVRALVGRVR